MRNIGQDINDFMVCMKELKEKGKTVCSGYLFQRIVNDCMKNYIDIKIGRIDDVRYLIQLDK